MNCNLFNQVNRYGYLISSYYRNACFVSAENKFLSVKRPKISITVNDETLNMYRTRKKKATEGSSSSIIFLLSTA